MSGLYTRLLRSSKTDNLFSIAQIESNYDEITDSFDSMNLKSELLRGLWCAVKPKFFIC